MYDLFIPAITVPNSLVNQIDPKRAIPRDEQEKTSKIFVGGVSQEATERDFESFFAQFGRVIDATLMMDKDTGRPRGFGFVTFEGDAAVEATLAQPLEIMGKPIEVKKAQPRGNLREEEEGGRGKFNNRRGQNDRFARNSSNQDNQQGGGAGGSTDNHQVQGQQNGQGPNNNMSPQMMAQYWQRMQQYFAMMQQQMAAGMTQGQALGGMPGANPAMMQQMMAMQAMGNQGQSGNPGSLSPSAQGPGGSGIPGGMNPAMMQQMQQAQQMQQMQQLQMQQQAQAQGGFPRMMSPGAGAGVGPMVAGVLGNRPPGYTAQEQLLFEQRKYEQQQARRMGPSPSGGYAAQGGPTSWEGMYDDVPQPNMGNQAGGGRGRGAPRKGSQGTPQPQLQPQGQAPANAPTGPKNAGKPGANYRGGGRSGNRGFHPYAR